jgi:hypothetical protein
MKTLSAHSRGRNNLLFRDFHRISVVVGFYASCADVGARRVRLQAGQICDDRFTFVYLGSSCVVNEPLGDNSRYWIGPVEKEPPIDMTPIRDTLFRGFA